MKLNPKWQGFSVPWDWGRGTEAWTWSVFRLVDQLEAIGFPAEEAISMAYGAPLGKECLYDS